jgi:hypothetical protein
MADKCDPIRSNLADLEAQLANTEKFEPPDPGNGHGPVGKPHLNPDWTLLNSKVRTTRQSLQTCEASLLPPPPPPPPLIPVPLTLTLTKFVCQDQSDEIDIPFIGNTENDEPYAVAFAVDLKTNNLASIPVGAINSKMTLIGPLSDVQAGGGYPAPPNIIWGLSGAADLITSGDDFIVLVAMMENDSGSPNQVRTVLEKAAQLSLATNVPAFVSKQIPRQELVNRLVNDMAGVMGVAKAGIPDPDDNIGPIQELRFLQADLDGMYSGRRGPIENSLTFEGDDAKYVLEFRMFR